MVESKGKVKDAIVFDFDGTLYKLVYDVERIKKRNGSKDRESLKSLLSRLTPDLSRQVLMELDEAELAGVYSGRPIEYAEETLTELDQEYIIYIVSRNSRACIKLALESMRLTFSPGVIAREDVKHLKPDPMALDLIRVQHSILCVIGDTFHDVEMAAAFGVPSVVLNNPALQYVPKNADNYINSLVELPELLRSIACRSKIQI